MRILLIIAWRNLWRHTRRTLLTATTVAMGLALLFIFFGLNDGGHAQMIEDAARMGSGHVVIQRQGYQERGGIDLALSQEQIEKASAWARSAGSRFPIESVTGRIFSSGLASSADGSTGIQIIGLDPEVERQHSIYPEKIVEGEFLEVGDGNLAVIGEGIARKLEVDLGGKLVLMSQGVGTSEIQSILVRVKGILKTGVDEVDLSLVLAPLKTCEKLFLLPERLHQVALLSDEHRRSTALAEDGRRALEQFDLEVLSWKEAMPELYQFILVDDGGNYIFDLFLFLLIAFMVLNTLLMSVLERRREFSLLDALGLSGAQRFAMVMTEAVLIASLSIAIGSALGYAAHSALHVWGLPLSAFGMDDATMAGVAFNPVLYSELYPERVALSIGSVFTMTMLLALFPAARAARKGSVQILGSD